VLERWVYSTKGMPPLERAGILFGRAFTIALWLGPPAFVWWVSGSLVGALIQWLVSSGLLWLAIWGRP
jgi:hypothetical protein